MEILKAKHKDKAWWNRFVRENYPPIGAFMQTWEWGNFKKGEGRKVERFYVRDQSKIVAVFTLVEYKLPLGFLYGYAPRGPVVEKNYATDGFVAVLAREISVWARKAFPKLLFIRLEPPYSHLGSEQRGQHFHIPDFYIQPRHNHAVLLDKPEVEIIAGFHSSTRSNIHRAENRGVRVVVKNHGKEDCYSPFRKIGGDTIQRNDGKNLYPSVSYFESFFKTFLPFETKHNPDTLTVVTFFGYQHDDLAAVHFVLFFADTATYLYGASSTAHLQSKVTTYLHWSAMQEAKKHGMKYYDLGGIDEKLWPSLTKFKRQFKGEEFNYIGNIDLPLRPFLYSIFNSMQWARKTFHHVRETQNLQSKKVFVAVFVVVLLTGTTFLSHYFWGDDSRDRRVETRCLAYPAACSIAAAAIPEEKILSTDYHVFQTFNNCAPAALSMALSYYGILDSQEKIAQDLRPHNNSTGDNDDKSTPPQELADYVKQYGLIPYFRPHGNVDVLKQFLAKDIPVVVRTLLYEDKDYAHYRVIKGYDDVKQEFIQDDSLEGKNLAYSYEDFLLLWKPFNYAYLVFATAENQKEIEEILGEDVQISTAWMNARFDAEKTLSLSPSDVQARFNLAVALYYLGDHAASAIEFEKVEQRLSAHMLWYQIEPIENYFMLKNYEKVFSLSDSILNNNNRAFSELYILRGKSYLNLGRKDMAKGEFKKAVYFNTNSEAARDALNSVSDVSAR
ncbi:MAG: peptidoglycan bridge formation glycyltransferase FemA/FemB family protein [Candidatus Paceibacterota bacterium]|jgi:lipid II:glycine glycyltransferase (peptidoglycan interpeptide bridge formation enzyme)